MKVLVSTKEGQGRRKSDFCFLTEGELVQFGFECDHDRGKIDGGCGCLRSMVGIESRYSTTTFKAIEMTITKEEFIGKLIKSFKEAWNMNQKEATKYATEEGEELLHIAKIAPLGKVLEKRGSKIQVRTIKA